MIPFSHLCLSSLLIFVSSISFASSSLWHDIQQHTVIMSGNTIEQRILSLDEANLQTLLLQSAEPEVSIPLPQGGYTTVRFVPDTLLSDALVTQYPQIKTWRLEGLDEQIQSGRADLTPLGLHVMLLTTQGDTLFIEPQQITDLASERQYRSLSKTANATQFKRNYSCGAQTAPANKTQASKLIPNHSTGLTLGAKAGETLHTYRIAVAATGEYTAYFGGDQAKALSAIVTTLNRVNGILERDLSIKLKLVSNTNIVYTDPNTDPYDATLSTSQLIGVNQTVLDDVIGNTNYDIGHLFTTGVGGIAIIQGLCNDPYKGHGLSGWFSPEGDTFAIDFVAHEIGHQLGATHTFNSDKLGNCNSNNRTGATAYEPGSGSSIMAYAGACKGDDLQLHSDTAFHAGSIAQITNFAHLGSGANCATKTAFSNHTPVVDAGANYTIPANTPFVLSGTASDVDNDSLTYSWEQMDAGAASNVDVDKQNNAILRAYAPSSSATRMIPRFTDLVSGSHTIGEILPTTSRKLTMRLQVRDGKGGTGFDDTVITTVATGAVFGIVSPTKASMVAGSTTEVKWTVASTDQAPISCATVDIAFNAEGTEDGFQDLVKNVPNTGTASVTLPTTFGSKNLIRVKCSNNIFFALSGTNSKATGTGGGTTGGGTTGGSTTSGGGGSLPFGLLLGLIPLLALRARKRGNQ